MPKYFVLNGLLYLANFTVVKFLSVLLIGAWHSMQACVMVAYQKMDIEQYLRTQPQAMLCKW